MERSTTKLMALVFDDPYKADEAHAAINRMAGEGLLDTDETAVIVRSTDGKAHVSQDKDVVTSDRRVGHIVGLVAAAATGTVPLIMVGTLSGMLIGKLTDHGITNAFVKGVEKQLQPGTSALIILGRSDPERRKGVVERMRTFNPTILESDLPPGLERELQEGVRAQTAVPGSATQGEKA